MFLLALPQTIHSFQVQFSKSASVREQPQKHESLKVSHGPCFYHGLDILSVNHGWWRQERGRPPYRYERLRLLSTRPVPRDRHTRPPHSRQLDLGVPETEAVVTHATAEQKSSEREPGSICLPSAQVGTGAQLASAPGKEGSGRRGHVRWARNQPLIPKATELWGSGTVMA